MRKIYAFIVLFLPALFLNAQMIECPDDVIVDVFNLDDTFQSYGKPDVTDLGSNELLQNFTRIDNTCSGEYRVIVNIKYSIENQQGEELTSCIQTISVERPTIDMISFPDDYTISEGTIDELAPEFAGQPEPGDLLLEYSYIGYTFHDDIFETGTSVKVIRNWTIIDWCSEETKEHTQVLEIEELSAPLRRTGQVTNCTNDPIDITDIRISTDVIGYTVEYGTCSTDNSVLEFVNCVAELNDIPADKNFTISVNRTGDDLNGVSTLDLVLIQRHILGVDDLGENCKLLSADANNDSKISAIDLVEIRKLILGIYNELPSAPSWKFFNSKRLDSGSIPTDDNDLKFAKSEFPLSDLSIVGLKIGDVNNSARGK